MKKQFHAWFVAFTWSTDHDMGRGNSLILTGFDSIKSPEHLRALEHFALAQNLEAKSVPPGANLTLTNYKREPDADLELEIEEPQGTQAAGLRVLR